MPELAEVALYAKNLNKISKCQKLIGVSFPNQKDWGSLIIPLSIQKEFKKLVFKEISFSSNGKALLLHLKTDPKPIIEFRLGMTGQFQLLPLKGKWQRHVFLELKFENNTIRYSDPRRFGRLSKPITNFHSLGGFNLKCKFWQATRPVPPKGYLKNSRISWLLGNGVRTGVGNYMANEALGLMNLSPFTNCKSEREAISILKKCALIAKKSFASGGNSFGSGFYNIYGDEGKYSNYCQFYQNPNLNRILFRGRPVYTTFKLPKSHKLP